MIEDTVEPSLPVREINLKVCAPEIRTRNLPVDPGIEPRLLRHQHAVLVGAHCLGQLSHRGRLHTNLVVFKIIYNKCRNVCGHTPTPKTLNIKYSKF